MSIDKRLQALSLRSCTTTEFAFMKAVEEMGERVEWMGGCEAVFNLSGEQGGPELRENYGFDSKALKRIWAELQGNQAHLIRQWEVIHGTNR